jgi:hypothetical protein
LPLFVVLFPFSFRVRGRVKGSKDPKDDDRRGKLVSKGNGRILDGWADGLLDGVIERNGPLCAFDRGTYF